MPSENTTNGALVVSVDGMQVPGSGGTLVMMVVFTVSKFTAAVVPDRQSMVAVRIMFGLVSIEARLIGQLGGGELAGVFSARTA